MEFDRTRTRFQVNLVGSKRPVPARADFGLAVFSTYVQRDRRLDLTRCWSGGDSNRRSALRFLCPGRRLVSQGISTRSFSKPNREVSPKRDSSADFDRYTSGAKDPKETGSSNPLRSTNRSPQTGPQIAASKSRSVRASVQVTISMSTRCASPSFRPDPQTAFRSWPAGTTSMSPGPLHCENEPRGHTLRPTRIEAVG